VCARKRLMDNMQAFPRAAGPKLQSEPAFEQACSTCRSTLFGTRLAFEIGNYDRRDVA
jgi:hypothetical protein